VDVSGFPSHGVEQAEFDTGATQGREFDAGAVRSKAADDPTPAELDERIGTADGAVDDRLVENFGGTFLLVALDALRPVRGRRDQGFGFAGDASAVPISNSNKAGVAETAQSGDAMSEAISNAGRRQKMFDGIDGADGSFGLQRTERVHFLPETDGIAQLAFGDQAQPLVLFAENESSTMVSHAFAIALEHSVANVFALEGKIPGLDREMSADGKPH